MESSRMDVNEEKWNLYEAAKKGDVLSFMQLHNKYPNLVDAALFECSRNILHIATMHKQEEMVEVITRRYPLLARNLDSQKSSPLHIAAAYGSVEMVPILLREAPKMLWWRDSQGMNPVHIAAMNGHGGILAKLLELDSFPAMERLHRGQTVLHLCVKHREIWMLKILVARMGELVYAKDDDGETILHLAVRCNQLEIIQYLVENNKIEKDTPNSMGKTALQILKESPTRTTHYSEIEKILLSLSNKSALEALPEVLPALEAPPNKSVLEALPNKSALEALPKLTDITMVVVVLITTMAFQAAVSPPGGVWQDDTSSHKAGEAVMASTHPKKYKHFVRANTTAFISSLVTIFLITTRQPSGSVYFLLIALYAMWVSLASIAVSYGASIFVITPNTETKSLVPIIISVVVVSVSIMAFILVCGLVRRLYLSWKAKKRRQEDLTTDSLILRLFYRIFQLLEPLENFELKSFLAGVIRSSGPNSQVRLEIGSVTAC